MPGSLPPAAPRVVDPGMDDDAVDLSPRLVTVRLLLRCVRPGDAASLTAVMTPVVSRWVANQPTPFLHFAAGVF